REQSRNAGGLPVRRPATDGQHAASIRRHDVVPAHTRFERGGQPRSSGINWDMAKNNPRHTVASHGAPSIPPADYAKVEESLRRADLWLGSATDLPSGVQTAQAWNRSEWIERTMGAWAQLCDPLTSKTVQAMGQNLPKEMQSVAGPLLGMVQQMGGMMVGQQAGQAVGELAREVIGTTDIGLPLA